MPDEALFDIDPRWRYDQPGRSARRTRRALWLLDRGLHPLSAPLRRSLRLHLAWDVRAQVGQARPHCGSCINLARLDLDDRRSPYKCWFDHGSRVTRGEATTIRRWWPACVNYAEAKK